MDIKYIRDKITIKSDRPIRLNQWTGSTLRGAICNKLMQDCIRRDRNCGECDSYVMCPNAILFNNKMTKENIINPVIINSNYYGIDNIMTNTIEFELVLFGSGLLVYNNVLEVLKEGVDISHTNFKLCKHTEDIEIESLKNLELSNHIKVSFDSPLNLRWLKIGAKFEFNDLMKAILIRTKAVYDLMNMEQDYRYLDLLEKAEKVEVVRQDTSYVNMVRNSKKNGENKLKCLAGSVEYIGDVSEFIPYMSLASLVNIGKWCSMGLGRVSFN